MDNKKKAFKCTPDEGASFFISRDIENIAAEIGAEENVGAKFTIEVIEIDDDALAALPEFDGW